MRYPEHLLTDDEVIVRQFHPHWRVLLPAAAWTLVGVATIVVAWVMVEDNAAVSWSLTAAGILVVLLLAGMPWLRWRYTLYVLTTERLIVRGGILSRRGVEIPLENINDVRFSQSVVERLLRYGDVVLESAGELGQSTLNDIPEPERFQSQVYAARETRSVALSGGGATRDTASQLESLVRLRDDGHLTEEEFQDAKRRLLEDSAP